MKIRYYGQDGKEIKTPCEPSYFYRNNSKENRPPDYVVIKQLEIKEMITDPYGQEQEINKLSDPVEEVYCGWVLENETWYCTVRMVVRRQEVILDRRPVGWKFFEEFNKHRPDFRR